MPSPTRLDELLRSYHASRAAGRPVSLPELCRDCPELLDDLQRRIAADTPPRSARAVADTIDEITPDAGLGNCAWFIWDLRRSNLIERGRLEQVVGDYLADYPAAQPEDLAGHLVAAGHLTTLQSERILQGRSHGFVLGPYVLADALGAGSMGTVYKAESKNDHKSYAIKVLPRRSVWNVRLARRWVRSFENCDHPSVVPFVDVGTAGGQHYLAWPLVAGETLDRYVAARGRLSAEQTARFGVQAAEGLDVCHQQGLFHGLLKPSNLMVGPDIQLRILDFGIGCLLGQTEGESMVDTMSTANSVYSGLDCASPESIIEPTNLTPIGDQYSLGCVLYFCLAGQYPFPGGAAVEKMVAHQHKQPPPLLQLAPGAPAGLVEVIERLMRKDPADRFADCAEVAAALQPFASKQQKTRPSQFGPRPAQPSHEPLPPRSPSQTAQARVALSPAGAPANSGALLTAILLVAALTCGFLAFPDWERAGLEGLVHGWSGWAAVASLVLAVANGVAGPGAASARQRRRTRRVIVSPGNRRRAAPDGRPTQSTEDVDAVR